MADAGNLFWKAPRVPPDQLNEVTIKARLQADALALVGIDAMLPGEGDWAMGRPFVEEMGQKLPYTVGNLQCDQKLAFPAYRLVQRGGLTIAFVGIVGPDLAVPGCRPTEPQPAIAAAEAERPDILVVLSGQHHAEDDGLAKKDSPIDLVLNGRDRQLMEAADPLPNGGLWIGGGGRGKQLTVAEIALRAGATSWRDEGAASNAAATLERYTKRRTDLQERLAKSTDAAEKTRLERQVGFFDEQVKEAKAKVDRATTLTGTTNDVSMRLVEMGTSVPDHAETAKLVAAAKEKISGGVVETKAYAGPFVGSGACATCHTAEHTQWQSTRHAHAFETLTKDKRQGELACVTCHSTGMQHPDGPHLLAEVLPDVGCESCHGPGRDHAAQPQQVHMTKDPPEATCVVCHDAQNDGGRFDFATYRPKVLHK